MKTILLLICIAGSVLANGQENTVNFLQQIKNYNISHVLVLDKFQTEFEQDTDWIKRAEPLGYIGENYQRFYIHLISVIQNPKNTLEYLIYGKTRVKTNICPFQGFLRIEKAFTYKGDEAPDLMQGFVEGSYEFYEDPNKKGSGILKGKFKTDFYIDKNNQIIYNAFSFVADGYCNNQFEGTWTSYISKESKKCNWGDYRIPDSKELDSGTGEFSPDRKYRQFGWEDYAIMIGVTSGNISREKAKLTENEKWWKEKNNN